MEERPACIYCAGEVMEKYIKLWVVMTSRVTQVAFASRFGVIFFTLGKIVRFLIFLLFLVLLVSKTKTLVGYTVWQVILFFITFNFVDIIAQFFLREVYRFRSYIVSGNFDYTLIKPLSPLFRSLFGGSDILDLVTLLPLSVFLFYTVGKIGPVTGVEIFLYILLVVNALIISIAFHIFVLGLGVITTEVDNAIWMFREITALGRIPVAVYREPVSWILTFILPVAVMISFPTQALLGLLTTDGIVLSFVFSGVLLSISFWFWKYSLRHYGSASS